jgi:hypothetical protein
VALMTKNFSAEIRDADERAIALRRAADALWRAAGRSPQWARKSRDAHQAEIAECALRREAAQAFADLNGWRRSNSYFGTRTLAKGGVHSNVGYLGGFDPLEPHQAFDHPLHFRERQRPYRTVAIIGQPHGTPIEDARRIAAELGLELRAPTNLTACWHNPGECRFFVFTRPGTSVRFLPEQSAGNEEAGA